jgi:hypothetical protein
VTTFKILMGAATLWPVLLLLASQREPPRQPAEAVPDAFAERWGSEELAAPKADRLQLPAPAASLPAPIEAAAPVERRTLKLASVGDFRQARAERRHRDICDRHGLRKIVTRGGKSWRCAR